MHNYCPRCTSDQIIKSGYVNNRPRSKCKRCNYQFTRMTPKGIPAQTKAMAVILYLSGISMNRIAKLSGVSAQAVLNWIRDFAKKTYEKPDPTGQPIIMELDEMWHYVKKNVVNCGSGKPLIVLPVNCSIGNVADVIYVR